MAKRHEFEQNDISAMRTQGIDLAPRWKAILQKLHTEGFVPDERSFGQSQWWKTGKIGAVRIEGTFDTHPAVLKIQGTKPNTSEADMITAFAAQNKSSIIRPPVIYASYPWSDEEQYEALIFEKVDGNYPIENRPSTKQELDLYFSLYDEYRKKCRNTPWVQRPQTYDYRKSYEGWRAAVIEQVKQDTFAEKDDESLAEKGIKIIERQLSVNDLEFVHGHFQTGDLIIKSQNEVVLFSNLFWSWRVPFYDAVFCYHWWMLGMEHCPKLTSNILEEERKQWMNHLLAINNTSINIALLERAIPALMVDRFMMDQEKESAGIITQGAREELKRLVSLLS